MKKRYQSELTKFLTRYKRTHPDTEKQQKEGRALLWDKYIDFEALASFKASDVKQKGYVYQSNVESLHG